MEYEIGDKVILNPDSAYCGDSGELPEGVVGTVRSFDNDDEHNLEVTWNEGEENNAYRAEDLLPARPNMIHPLLTKKQS